jgi:hypothetical protein
MQDYRAKSYQERAKDISSGAYTPSETRSGYSGETSSIPTSDISILSQNIVSGYGQVAIAPDKDVVGGELQFTSKGSSTPSETVASSASSAASSPVSGAALLAFQSPELAQAAREGRLQPQSVSSGQAYQMSFRGQDKPATAYTVGSKFEKKQVAETKKPSKLQKIKNIVTTPFTYAFTPQPIPFQETTQAQVQGREAFTNVLLMGGVGITARPTQISSSKVTFGGRQTAQVIESETGFNTNIKVQGAGYIDKSIFGIKYGKPQSFRVTGSIVEKAKPIDTEVFGLVGDEQVFGTSASGKFNINTGKQVVSSSFESKGFEVAGAGKRQVVQQVGKAPAETFNEAFITESSGDVTRGSVVSPKGAVGFVSEVKAEASLPKNIGNVYFNPETGLESSTPTLTFKPQEVVNVKYLKISSAGKSDLPFSAEYTYEAAGGRIRSNLNPVADITGRDVVGGSVSEAGQSQILQSQVVSKPSGGQFFNTEQVVVNSLQKPSVNVKLPVASPGLVSVGKGNVKSELVGSVNVGVSRQSQVVSPQSVSLFGVKSSSVVASDVKSESVLGQSQFSGLARVSKQKSNLVNDSIVSSSVVSGQDVLGRQGLRSMQVQGQMQNTAVVQSLKFNSARALGGIGTAPPVFSSVKPFGGVGFNLPKGGRGVFGVEVRRGGVFRQVGSGLSLKGAVGLGQARVSGSAAATFRVTQGGSPVRITTAISPQFYSKGTSVIERNKYRITSAGELSEITFKGIRANRG